MTGPGQGFLGYPVVPLASVADIDHVEAMGEGLVRGGLPIVEVALRGELGLAALRRFSERGDLAVGAGTVLDVEQARQALDAGATFVVTPGLTPDVVRYVTAAGMPVVPGVITPTEVQEARALGLRRVKLFHAGNFGGLTLLSAYADVYRDMSFMPSGGVGPDNVADYLAHPAVFAASGSWILAEPDTDTVAERAAAAQLLGTHD